MEHLFTPCSAYSYDELAAIYNAGRPDYIVPMPMNGKRLQEYVLAYDVDLEASWVAVDPDDKQPNGLIMYGIRGDRGWITRLGVIPERRRKHTGQALMQKCLEVALERGHRLVQLEVIKGNDPAYRLFQKLGFVDTRELLVIRRAPAKLPPHQHPTPDVRVRPIDRDFEVYFEQRERNETWVEETQSLLNIAPTLTGFMLTIPHLQETGWVIFQKSAYQLTHFVFSSHSSAVMLAALIAQVHFTYALADTKIENLPIAHPAWPILQQFGYVEAFRRIEMFWNP